MTAMPTECPRCRAKCSDKNPFCPRCQFDLRHGNLSGTKRGNCAYCDRHGALTYEHPFPSWLKQQFPRHIGTINHVIGRPAALPTVENWDFNITQAYQPAKKPFVGSLYDVQVAYVCADCNNGWMSKLQLLAKPILLQLANGNIPNFSKEECVVLARWCAMTNITFEYLGRIPTSTQNHRTALMSGKMPEGWHVALGILENSSAGGFNWYRPLKVAFQVEDEFLAAQSTVWCIERVGFHCFSSVGDRVIHILPSFLPIVSFANWNERHHLHTIWPTKRFLHSSLLLKGQMALEDVQRDLD